MFPEVLRIGDFVITSFGVMLMLSFLVGEYVLGRQLERYGRSSQLAWDLILWIMIGGLVGAKLYFHALHWNDDHDPVRNGPARRRGSLLRRGCAAHAVPRAGDRDLTLLPWRDRSPTS